MTLKLPRPNVQINPGRLGPPRLTPKEQQALAQVSDPVLRKTLGEMFLAARGNQENFDELAQQFPIQPHNAADALQGEPLPIEALGDLITGDSEALPAILPVGADGQVLTADSGSPIGLSWQEPWAQSPAGAGISAELALVANQSIPLVLSPSPVLVLIVVGCGFPEVPLAGEISAQWAGVNMPEVTNGGGTNSGVNFRWVYRALSNPTFYPGGANLKVTLGTKAQKGKLAYFVWQPDMPGGVLTNEGTGDTQTQPNKKTVKGESGSVAAGGFELLWSLMMPRSSAFWPLPTSATRSLLWQGVLTSGTQNMTFDFRHLHSPPTGKSVCEWNFEKEEERVLAEGRYINHIST